MSDTSSLVRLLRRAPWLVPLLALSLAALSVGLGQLAYARVLAQPDHPISFIVDDGLPHGITQETVEAAAAGRALSYEPFTMLVVEQELSWQEREHGDIPHGADVMLSVGYDPEDPDLTLPDATRAAVATLATSRDWQPHFRATRDIRETFLNNLTQGHGPGAVVGAALTAASEVYDTDTRSPVFWGSIAALPLMASLLMTLLWLRFIGRERQQKRVFSRARLQLARVVLELDLLEAHVHIATAELDRSTGRAARAAAEVVRRSLRRDWLAIRRDSLRLAHAEQLLTREFVDPRAPVHERGAREAAMPLDEFAAGADALRRRADALATASSLPVGHAASGTALGRIALPTLQAVDEIIRRANALPRHQIERLRERRDTLLALVEEGDSAFDPESGPNVVVRHADLMKRWRRAEKRLTNALTTLESSLRRPPGSDGAPRITESTVAERERERVRSVTGGALDTMENLRASLGIARRGSHAPSFRAERVLLLLDHCELPDRSVPPRQRVFHGDDGVAAPFAGTALVVAPVIAALLGGWIAVGTMEENTSYGRTLTGDQPLAALHLAGDVSQIPDYAAPRTENEPPNRETLTLERIRGHMEQSSRYGDLALLPERLELIVVLVPLADYASHRPAVREKIAFPDLLDAYRQIKDEAAGVVPQAIDTATGDVHPGYAVLPVWLDDDGSYGAGLPLTGELSYGVDSRLGAYDFVAMDPTMRNLPGEDWSLPISVEVASTMSDLGRQMEYNKQRASTFPPAAMFWTVFIAVWTSAQTALLIGVSIAQALRHGAGTRHARRQLREMRQSLNRLAMGLDLSRLDAVAVLGATDGDAGRAAEADQRLHETVLLTAWREVQELEDLPRRMQRGPEWRARVARMRRVIDALAERDTDVADRALAFIRSGMQ